MSLLDRLFSGRDGISPDRPSPTPARLRQLVDGVVSTAGAAPEELAGPARRAERAAERAAAWMEAAEAPGSAPTEEELAEVIGLLEEAHFALLRGVVLGEELDGSSLEEVCRALERAPADTGVTDTPAPGTSA